ncbi:hypothetical protein [Yinghuangia soli]|uniref:Uncharacterized protein n=1 Tax=Yinghuangia soli TaxID=2908204 RepID=A0AA41PZP6_9ACTN|nr:hypothetical protein [Yinghuangia soli]MCF2528893.1 hypothetical protein [Yinghuangia soli]
MSASSQPKWAWWVVGIVIPVIGILVTIWAAGGSSSDADNTARETQSATGGQSGGGQSGGQSGGAAGNASAGASGSSGSAGSTGSASGPPAPAPDAPAKVLSGPAEITLKPGQNYLDLDTAPPLAMPSGKSADLVALFNVGSPGLVTEGSPNTLALLPAEGPDPTAAECADAVQKRGSYQAGDLTRGARYCVQTDEGHTAYLKVLTAVAIETPVKFQVTVWE